MSLKTSAEERKEKGRKEGRDNVRDFLPIPPSSKKKSSPYTELKASDFLNILTRIHLSEILKDYGRISNKHNRKINIRWILNSCSDLKKGEISRLDELEKAYQTIGKGEGGKEGAVKKGKKKSSSSPHEKNAPSEMLNVIRDLHNLTIEGFMGNIFYTNVGFNKFRYNQCPNIKLYTNTIKTGLAPNRILQETMLSLKITNEQMISEGPEEKDIRILGFGITETIDELEIDVDIPEMKKNLLQKILLRSSKTGVFLYVKNHKGKNYTFEVFNLANKINMELKFDCVVENSVTIYVTKQEKRMWQELFHYEPQHKARWQEEMKKVLDSMKPDAQEQMEPLDYVWNIALILVNCRANLLNLPHDLNHVNEYFETLEEMIIYYKTMISFNPHLKALFYILGGALYSNIMKSSSTSNFKKPRKKKDFHKYKKEVVDKITKRMENYAKIYVKGGDLFLEKKYKEANAVFDEASSVCTDPNLYLRRGDGLLELGRYKEAIMDSIFALRNLGPCQGFPAFSTILKYKIRSGDVIRSIDMTISLEYNYKQTEELLIQRMKIIREIGLWFLNSIFKSYSLIFRKKYKDAIPFLEDANRIQCIKSGDISVILLLLYFICKNYEKVLGLGEKILEDCKSYRDLIYYLLGMSAYYRKKLRVSINYLRKIRHCCLGELTKIKKLRDLINKADDLIINGVLDRNLNKGRFYVADILTEDYNKAMKLAKDNDQLSAHILTKLGVLNYKKRNFKEVVKYLTRCIDLVGRSKNILIVRSEAYRKLNMMNKAKEDYEEATKYVRLVQQLKNMELKKIRKRSI